MNDQAPETAEPYAGVARKNLEPDFDDLLRTQLKCYVYALGGPEPGSIFYIGKAGGAGDGNQRVLDHFLEAERVILAQGARRPSKKQARIIDEWRQGRPVVWSVLRYGLTTNEARHVEAALIDTFGLEQLTNQKRELTEHGKLTLQDMRDMAAPTVAPVNEHPLVLLFPIGNTLEAGADVYQATRHAWTIGEPFRTPGALAIGIARGISRGVFHINEWVSVEGGLKREFVGTEMPGHELLGCRFTAVIAQALVYWSYGNFLAVELRPGQFRFVRGATDQDAWHTLPS